MPSYEEVDETDIDEDVDNGWEGLDPEEKSEEVSAFDPFDELEIVFAEEGEIPWGELAEFMHLFRAWYLLAVDRLGADVSPEFAAQNADELARSIRGEEPESVISEVLRRDYHQNDLLIVRARKESPLIIWALGILTAATFAAILSGGEVDISKGRFKLNPLGDGIKKLRSALRRDH